MTIGQKIRIEVIGADVSTGKIDFIPVGNSLSALGAPVASDR